MLEHQLEWYAFDGHSILNKKASLLINYINGFKCILVSNKVFSQSFKLYLISIVPLTILSYIRFPLALIATCLIGVPASILPTARVRSSIVIRTKFFVLVTAYDND